MLEDLKPPFAINDDKSALVNEARQQKNFRSIMLHGIQILYFYSMKGLTKTTDKILANFVSIARQYETSKRSLQDMEIRLQNESISPQELRKRRTEQYPDKTLSMLSINEIEKIFLTKMIKDPEFRETLYRKFLPRYWDQQKPDGVDPKKWKSLLYRARPHDPTDMDAWNRKWDSLNPEKLGLQEHYPTKEDWQKMSPGRSQVRLMNEYYESFGITLQDGIVIKMVNDYYTTKRSERRKLKELMELVDIYYNFLAPFKRDIRNLMILQRPLTTRMGRELLNDLERIIPDPKYNKTAISRVFKFPVKKRSVWSEFGTLWKKEKFLKAFAASKNKSENEETLDR